MLLILISVWFLRTLVYFERTLFSDRHGKKAHTHFQYTSCSLQYFYVQIYMQLICDYCIWFFIFSLDRKCRMCSPMTVNVNQETTTNRKQQRWRLFKTIKSRDKGDIISKQWQDPSVPSKIRHRESFLFIL